MRSSPAVLAFIACVCASSANALCDYVQPQILVDVPAIYFEMRRVPGLQVAAAVGDHSGAKRSGGAFFNPIGNFTIHFQTQTDGENYSCVAVTAVNYVLQDPAPHYWIAEELPPGSCIEQELIKHELKHVAAFQRIYGNFSTQAYGLIQAAVANYPMQTMPGNEEQAREMAETAVRNATIGLLDRLAQTAEMENQQIDSTAEYDRLRDVCDGTLNEYLR